MRVIPLLPLAALLKRVALPNCALLPRAPLLLLLLLPKLLKSLCPPLPLCANES
jgi:hypothetical protein